jgi:two-component SAPR family response regulator
VQLKDGTILISSTDRSLFIINPGNVCRLTEENTVVTNVSVENGTSLILGIPHVDLDATKIVFTTAYDEYALQAFDDEAVDYILKPYGPTEVIRAINRVAKATGSKAAITRLRYRSKDSNT